MLDAYKEISIDNVYDIKILNGAKTVLISSGFEIEFIDNIINLKFDILDLNILKKHQNNPLVDSILKKIMRIRSFSITNGKYVYASFNNDRKVKNK